MAPETDSMKTISQSLEDYIEAVYLLSVKVGSACVRDVAEFLGVKMPSVVKAVHELKEHGLVSQQPYSTIDLTEEGKKVAKEIFGRHRLLCAFLCKLGVKEDIANIDACRMEHILSRETLQAIGEFMGGEEAMKALYEESEEAAAAALKGNLL